jgi:hypothetical protein
MATPYTGSFIADKSLTGEPILPSRTANQFWFAVRDGKIGSPVKDFHKSSPPPRVGRLHLHRCRPTHLRLMGGALAHSPQTTREVRATSLHSTPSL